MPLIPSLNRPLIKPKMWTIDPGIIAHNASRMGLPMPVAYPSIWEGAGDKTHDLVNQQYNGTCSGTLWQPTQLGMGLDFIPANNSFVEISSTSSILATLINSSVEALVVSDAAGGGSYGDAIYCERSSDIPIFKLQMETNYGVTLQFVHRNNSSWLTYIDGIQTIADGKIHHVVMTKRGTAIKLYVDGKFDAGGTLSGNDTLTAIACRIGDDKIDEDSEWDGRIILIRLYNETLTPSQVAILSADPFGLVRQPRRIFFPVFGAVTHTETTDLDALIKGTISQILSIDSLLQKSIPITVSLDSILKILRTATINFDALTMGEYLKQASLDGLIIGVGEQTFSVDAFLSHFGIEASLSIDSLLEKAGITTTVLLDAILLAPGVGTILTSLDTILKKYGVVFQVSLDSLLSKSEILTTSINAITQKSASITVVLDAVLLKSLTQSLYLDAYIKASQTANIYLDGYAKKLESISTSLDALIGILGLEIGLDALLTEALKTNIVSLDAMLLAGNVLTLSLDSIVYEKFTRILDVDALLHRSYESTTFLDAIIYTALITATAKYYFKVKEGKPKFKVKEGKPKFKVKEGKPKFYVTM